MCFVEGGLSTGRCWTPHLCLVVLPRSGPEPRFSHQPELDRKAVLGSTYPRTVLFWFGLPEPFQTVVNFDFDFDNIGLNVRLSSSGFAL
jgi:hypothetical protein